MEEDKNLAKLFILVLLNSACVFFWILLGLSLFYNKHPVFGIVCLAVSLLRLAEAIATMKDFIVAIATEDWYIWKKQ